MYEYATLQESYTGALIAGKGRELNNINHIMERNRFIREDWVRVRFGAGTPWRRCWCVITPPDEKEFNKLQKEMNKKKSAYDRSRTVLKGDVRFYDTRKTKKTKPIATLTEGYCAYAIYPQSKPLIDQSTLVKVEGTITIHSDPPTSTEGFVFVMPEVHPAVSGFEHMLRWLFPTLDTFALYGRPGRLVADTTNTQSLMFAMPTERRYGYLEILDVSNLILQDGSSNWTERQWRAKMKDATSKRMAAIANGSRAGSRYSTSSRRHTMRNSMSAIRGSAGLEFNDAASVKSTPSIRWGHGPPRDEAPFGTPPRTDSAPASAAVFKGAAVSHHRSVSESQGLDRYSGSGMDGQFDHPPPPPQHVYSPQASKYQSQMSPTPERVSFEDERQQAGTPVRELQDLQQPSRVEPVSSPPKFAHAAGTLPPTKPFHSPELRRAKSRMSQSTLAQITAAPVYNPSDIPASQSQDQGQLSEDRDQRGVPINPYASARGMNANLSDANEGLVKSDRLSFERPLPSEPHPESLISAPQHFQQPIASHNANIPNANASSQGVQSHAYNSSTDLVGARPRGRDSILRKPLPGRPQENRSSTNEVPRVMDKATFDQIVASRNTTEHSGDNASTASPDYASTSRPSNEYRPSFERPRAGVMRTVGSDVQPPIPSSDIPSFDFGPTINYAKAGPRTSSPQPPRSAGKNMSLSGPPNESEPRSQSQPRPHRGGPSPEPRQMAWQPGMSARPQSPGMTLTPEQFVQQRAAAPVYGQHARAHSANALRAGTPTPPLSARNEYFTAMSHSRNNSNDGPQSHSRSHSRSPSAMLGSGDMSNTLSAREQEHVARMTGSPLVNIPQSRQDGPQPGLVGAIDAREKERKYIKQGLSSQTVEREIAQRQQQQMALLQQQQMYDAQQFQQYPQPGRAPMQMTQQVVHGVPHHAQAGARTTLGGIQGRMTPDALRGQQQQYYPPAGQQHYGRNQQGQSPMYKN